MTIYNKTNNAIYSANLRMWNDANEQYDPDILQEIDTDLIKKWDPMIDMFVMDQEELNEWRDFWHTETECAMIGRSDLLDEGEYVFFCVKED